MTRNTMVNIVCIIIGMIGLGFLWSVSWKATLGVFLFIWSHNIEKH